MHGGLHASVVVDGGVQVERRYRVRNHAAGLDTRTAHDEAYAQQAVVHHRTFEYQAMVAQPIAMVGRVNNDGVIRQAQVVKFRQNAADVVVDKRDHAVVIGGEFPQLRIR